MSYFNKILPHLTIPEFAWQKALDAASKNGDERPTWAYDWPAGVRMASELSALVSLQGSTVLDLGCGRGILGLQALRLGARSVCFCDLSEHVLNFVEQICQYNKIDNANYLVKRWGDNTPVTGKFDVILGGDILYRPECFKDLAREILSASYETTQVLLSDPRHTVEESLSKSFSVYEKRITLERRDKQYTLIRVL